MSDRIRPWAVAVPVRPYVWPQRAGVAAAAALILLGSVLPWFTIELGPPTAPPLPGLVMTVLAAVVTLVLVVTRPRLAWIPMLIALAVGLVTWVVSPPGTTCWDGADAAGNPIGGCEHEARTAASWLFAVGLVLLAVATALVLTSARRSPPPHTLH